VKLRLHLTTEGPPSSRPFAGHFALLGSAAHRALARQAVRESLVLLKNARHLLPIAPRSRVLVAGDGADNVNQQSGGFTIDWQGTRPSADIHPAESIYAGIRAAVAAGGGSVELRPHGDFSHRPDVAIVVFGESPYAEGAGDVPSLAYRAEARDLALLRRLHAAGVPIVAVLLSGRPLLIEAELAVSDSFVAAWLPGAEGGGVADVLFRARDGRVAHDFRGRLPLEWPRSPGAAGDSSSAEPLFPYGYGLGYQIGKIACGDSCAGRSPAGTLLADLRSDKFAPANLSDVSFVAGRQSGARRGR
jgi:beta-glucosidase